MADEAKSKGSAAFSAGNYIEVVRHFTDTINLAPTSHVLYSNRSASYASLSKYNEALSDAKKTVELKPDWSKGYSRLGAAHIGLHNYNDVVEAYKKGLEIDPNNEALKSGLSDAQSAVATRSKPSNLFGDAFGPEMWVKLTSDPVAELNGDDMQEDGQEDGQDEAVVVDADSTDGAVLVNGNEADEEWGTNNAGNPSD